MVSLQHYSARALAIDGQTAYGNADVTHSSIELTPSCCLLIATVYTSHRVITGQEVLPLAGDVVSPQQYVDAFARIKNVQVR